MTDPSILLDELAQNPQTRHLSHRAQRLLIELSRAAEPPSVGTLGKIMGLDPRAMTKLIRSLTSRMLIKRLPSKTDLRVTRISLTPAGAYACDRLQELWRSGADVPANTPAQESRRSR